MTFRRVVLRVALLSAATGASLWLWWTLHPLPQPQPAVERAIGLESGANAEIVFVTAYDGLHDVVLWIDRDDGDSTAERYLHERRPGEFRESPWARLGAHVGRVPVELGPVEAWPSWWAARGARVTLGQFRARRGAEVSARVEITRAIPELQDARARVAVGPHFEAHVGWMWDQVWRGMIALGLLALGVILWGLAWLLSGPDEPSVNPSPS